jgi:RNA polymerase sigma factor (sigma-70 family)
MTSNEKDTDLWQAFLKGDESAYTTLYRNHIRAMYRYGISLVPASEAFVFDCIHDVFTEIWVKRNRLSLPDNVRHYLLKSLKNRVLHLLERKERITKPIENYDFDELWAEPSVEETFALKEESHNREELVKKLINQLPPRQQEVLRLRFVEDLDYKEIGELLSVNSQSAQNLGFRAIEKLRNWLIP